MKNLLLFEMNGHDRRLFCLGCWKWQIVCWFYYLTHKKIQTIMVTNEDNGQFTFITYSVSAKRFSAVRVSELELAFSRSINKRAKLIGAMSGPWFPPDDWLVNQMGKENTMRDLYPNKT